MAKSKRGKQEPRRVKKMGKRELQQLERQESERRQKSKLKLQRNQALEARDVYKARKSDIGKIVFIGVHGQRSARSKGRKGYLIYVTKTGKKWLLKQHVKRGAYKPRKFSEIQPPNTKALRNKAKKFKLAKLETIDEGRTVVKGSGDVKAGGPWDFSDRVVAEIAKSLGKTLDRVKSHRVFNIKAQILFKNPDGEFETMSFDVPFEKPDHIKVSADALNNFISKKFYAFMAQELSMSDYVTSGSSNHVRSLSVNEGRDREDWRKPYTDSKGRLVLMPWKAADYGVVTIQTIEWKIEQAKVK